ncbi:MAG: ATP-binding protein [Cyanobacteriota bacterium]|nr:ATP-binding protein [Cyanobacteriota bacterium]
MSPREPAPALLWRSRLRLAGLSLLVMGGILYGAGFTMARLLLQEQEAALRRELQTIAGTLHDSLKSSLPPLALPSADLAAVLPGLCLVDQVCPAADALIERHAMSATDPSRFQLRLFNARGQLLAATPGALRSGGPTPVWLEQRLPGGERLLSYAIHLHRAHGTGQQDWGTLQISRSLAPLDAEAKRLWWLGHGVYVLAMAGMALASWWLAGRAMAPLLEAYRRQEQFSADVAHELRTPLASLLALLEAERDALNLPPGPPSAENPMAATLERMLNQGRRLQRLIADLLLLATLEGPASTSQLQVVPLAEISADVVEDFSEAAAALRVTLAAAIEDHDTLVRGVESELSRLLINLLSNALQHSPPGSTVWVALERRGREIALSVQDQGPGIPAEAQERIFERFHRLDSARSHAQGGTGLGLAIAQAIARRHGGVIRVESTPGEGARFVLRLSAVRRSAP